MKRKLLEKAKKEIEKEMEAKGYIDDSDNCDRFLDNLAKELTETEQEKDELLDLIKDEIMIEYNKISYINDAGNYTGCWYKDLKGLVRWAGTWQDNSLQEAYQEFVDIYGIEITLKQFAEAYGVDIEDYD